MARVIVFRGRDKERTYELVKKRMVIGRGDDADIRVDNPLVSRAHAIVSFRDGHWLIEDLESPNGLYLNGSRTKSSRLQVGDRIELGRHVLIFEGTGESTFDVDTARRLPVMDGSAGEATAILRAGEVMDIQRRVRERMKMHLVIVSEGQRRDLPLDKDEYLIGYSESCTIRLPGKALFGKEVGRLKRDGDSYSLTSLTSLQKITINGARSAQQRLKDGDRIKVRGTTLQFHQPVGVQKKSEG